MHETVWSVLTSPPHVVAEVIITLVTDGLLYPVGKYLLKRHDKAVHGEHLETQDA